jgi:hypothetical protein
MRFVIGNKEQRRNKEEKSLEGKNGNIFGQEKSQDVVNEIEMISDRFDRNGMQRYKYHAGDWI